MNHERHETHEEGLRPLPPADVPVFDCRVLVGRCAETGAYTARVANLPQITARGNSQRDVLQQIVRAFKSFVGGYHQRGESVPWVEPSEEPGADEQQFWLPVHL